MSDSDLDFKLQDLRLLRRQLVSDLETLDTEIIGYQLESRRRQEIKNYEARNMASESGYTGLDD